MMMNFKSTAEFSLEFKRLSKKYRSLSADLDQFKKVVASIPCGTSKHFAVLRIDKGIKIVKARFFCEYLRGSSLRIIYAYHEHQNLIEFIELYFKGDKPVENRSRIDEYLKRC